MSVTSSTNFLVNLANQIDVLTNHFVFDGYSALATLLRAPLGSMIVLYIVLMGYAMLRGVIQAPQQELMKFTIRAGLIYMCAMNWSFFSSHIRDLLVVGSESIANALLKVAHAKVSGGSINQGLQDVLNEVISLGNDLFDLGSFRKLPPYFAGSMVLFSGIITIGFAFFEIITAKLMMAIMFATAPLFIIFTLFDQTKMFFERWLGILVGFALVLIFVSSVVGFCMHLIHWTLAGFHVGQGGELNLAIWIPIFIVSCFCVAGILQAVAIAKSIGGSLCTSGGAAMMGGFIGGALGSSHIAGRMAKQAFGSTLKGPADYARQKVSQAATSSASKLYQSIRRGGA